MAESRADVEAGNEEEQELEDCGHAVCRSWRVVCVKDRCVGKHLQFELLEKEGRKRTKPSLVALDCVFLTQENADTTLEYENEPSPEVFQEVKTCSCVEVVVRKVKRQCRLFKISAERNTSARITDDNSLLNWNSSFRNALTDGKVKCAIWRRGADIIFETHNLRNVCLSS